MSTEVRFNISGQAWSVISGSELSSDAVKYDGGTQGAQDALRALHNLRRVKRGRGTTYVCTTTIVGAQTIADYCSSVGETFAGESEAETRADGRALLRVAELVARELAAIDAPRCEWFALCDDFATGTTPHPVLGDVPTCDRHHAFATGELR